jgi:hypothetical protein
MGARGRPCRICADAQLLPQINAMLEAGSTQVSIAETAGVSKYVVGRHARHANLPAAIAHANGDSGSELQLSDDRLRRWLERSEAAWVAASALGDTKAAIDALRSGVRSELEHRRRLEKREKHAPSDGALLPNGQRPLSLQELDSLIREHRLLAKERGELCPECGQTYILGSSFVQPT